MTPVERTIARDRRIATTSLFARGLCVTRGYRAARADAAKENAPPADAWCSRHPADEYQHRIHQRSVKDPRHILPASGDQYCSPPPAAGQQWSPVYSVHAENVTRTVDLEQMKRSAARFPARWWCSGRRVVRVVKLIEQFAFSALGHLQSQVAGTLHPLLFADQDKLGAVSAHRGPTLTAHVVGPQKIR